MSDLSPFASLSKDQLSVEAMKAAGNHNLGIRTRKSGGFVHDENQDLVPIGFACLQTSCYSRKPRTHVNMP